MGSHDTSSHTFSSGTVGWIVFFSFTRLNSEKRVSTFMGTPVPATRPHPTLGLHRVNSPQSEVSVGEEAFAPSWNKNCRNQLKF